MRRKTIPATGSQEQFYRDFKTAQRVAKKEQQALVQESTLAPRLQLDGVPPELLKLMEEAAQKNAEDPSLKIINNIVKYTPIVINALQPLIQGLKEMNQQQMYAKQPQYVIPSPPVGYGTLEALRYVDDPQWQAQARAYDMYKKTGRAQSVQPQLVAPYTPPPEQAAYAMAEARAQQKQGLKSLQAQAEAEDAAFPEVTLDADGDSQRPVPVHETTNPPSAPSPQPSSAERIMMQDTENAIQVIVSNVKSMDQQSWLHAIKNNGIVDKISPWIPLLPSNYKGVILSLNCDALHDVLAKHCPDQWSWITEAKLVEKLDEQWTTIQQKIKPKV